MSLSSYLDIQSVVFLDALTVEEALKTLVQVLGDAGKLKNRENFYKAILEREKVLSTGIGLGIAVPHAKLSGYKDFFVAIGVQKNKGIEWSSLDASPVHFIFMIGGPDNRQKEYLNILARLATALKHPETRAALLETTEAQQVIDLFKGY